MVGSIEETQKSTYDRKTELQAFDDTKAGVKGLFDAGITKVPRIFLHPPESLKDINIPTKAQFDFPVIDFEGFENDGGARREMVDRVGEAAEKWGFFQVVNHGIPEKILEEMMDGVRRFMEQETEIKKQYYTRDITHKFFWLTNFDLFSSPAAQWRDSIYCNYAPNPPNPQDLPSLCSEITIEYAKHVMGLGKCLLQLLSESLGLSKNHLLDMESAESLFLISHYSPPCPEPDRTFRTTRHSDNNFLTVLLQDNLGGLQVRHQDQWVDVPPLPGALIVNMGDLLQLVTNDKFKSAEHRVLASTTGPRISVASFFGRTSGPRNIVLAPIDELCSEDNPSKYRATTATEYTKFFRAKGLDGTSALLHFKL